MKVGDLVYEYDDDGNETIIDYGIIVADDGDLFSIYWVLTGIWDHFRNRDFPLRWSEYSRPQLVGKKMFDLEEYDLR